MADIPYMVASGSIIKILEKIKEAATPEVFSQDFLKTKLGFKGGNYLSFIPWAKKAGLLQNDGAPTQLYKNFRNPTSSGAALAKAIKSAYSELYSRNEYCHELDKKDFKGLVMETTGDSHDSPKVDKIVNTFFNAKTLANFETNDEPHVPETTKSVLALQKEDEIQIKQPSKKVNLGLSYTINLILPKTDDPAIFNAIFKSLKENLLDS